MTFPTTAERLARFEELAHSRCTQQHTADQLCHQATSGWLEMARIRVIDRRPWNLLVPSMSMVLEALATPAIISW